MFSPNETTPNFECKSCSIICRKQSDWNRHLSTTKHKNSANLTNPEKLLPSNCTICDKIFSSKYELKKHITTKSHTDRANNVVKTHECDKCNKVYNSYTGLWQHKRKCTVQTQTQVPDILAEVLKSNNELQKQNQDIQKQNHDLQQQILDVCKNNVINNNTINANNSNNKTFNLQVFLNEECKDAMNISDFMSSIQVQLEELECVGRLGFVEGISKIIIKNLKALDIRKRPVHCTDLKRETVYIKENGVWVKDDESNTKLRKVIKNVSFRNSKNTRLYRDKYPDCVRSESRLSDIYSIIIIEAMGGGSKTDPKESEDKILRRILKELVFDKSRFLS